MKKTAQIVLSVLMLLTLCLTATLAGTGKTIAEIGQTKQNSMTRESGTPREGGDIISPALYLSGDSNSITYYGVAWW